ASPSKETLRGREDTWRLRARGEDRSAPPSSQAQIRDRLDVKRLWEEIDRLYALETIVERAERARDARAGEARRREAEPGGVRGRRPDGDGIALDAVRPHAAPGEGQ